MNNYIRKNQIYESGEKKINIKLYDKRVKSKIIRWQYIR